MKANEICGSANEVLQSALLVLLTLQGVGADEASGRALLLFLAVFLPAANKVVGCQFRWGISPLEALFMLRVTQSQWSFEPFLAVYAALYALYFLAGLHRKVHDLVPLPALLAFRLAGIMVLAQLFLARGEPIPLGLRLFSAAAAASLLLFAQQVDRRHSTGDMQTVVLLVSLVALAFVLCVGKEEAAAAVVQPKALNSEAVAAGFVLFLVSALDSACAVKSCSSWAERDLLDQATMLKTVANFLTFGLGTLPVAVALNSRSNVAQGARPWPAAAGLSLLLALLALLYQPWPRDTFALVGRHVGLAVLLFHVLLSKLDEFWTLKQLSPVCAAALAGLAAAGFLGGSVTGWLLAAAGFSMVYAVFFTESTPEFTLTHSRTDDDLAFYTVGGFLPWLRVGAHVERISRLDCRKVVVSFERQLATNDLFFAENYRHFVRRLRAIRFKSVIVEGHADNHLRPLALKQSPNHSLSTASRILV